MQPILFIAGGIWQRSFVKYLKEKGHYIVIVNPVSNDTTKLADYHILCDINDDNTINAAIDKFKPIFITSDQSDISTSIVSRLSAQWGLPSNSEESIKRFTDKLIMHAYAKEIGVPTPDTEEIDSLEGLRDFGRSRGYPIIIKPIDSTMSRGFRVFVSDDEVTQAVIDSSKRFSRSGRIISQPYIAGTMVTLEGVCSGGWHKTLATSTKKHYIKPGITSGVRYPSDLPDPLMYRIIQTNDHYVESSGLQFGLTHSEYIITGDARDDYVLLEIGARGGGAGITDKIVPWSTGINTYDILYDSLLGKITNVKALRPLKKPALLRYYLEKEVDLPNAKIIADLRGVSIFSHNFASTQYSTDLNDCRYSMAIYLADTAEEMDKLERQINQYVNPNLTEVIHG